MTPSCQGLGRLFGHSFQPVYNETREWAPLIVDGTVKVVASGAPTDWMNTRRTLVAVVCRRCGSQWRPSEEK